MWDFDFGRTMGIMVRTWPFILLRLVVYFTITLAYVLATGVGAGIGFGIGHIFADPDDPAGGALFGGVGGIILVSVVLYWLREYILYMVKAGHIAVMVELIEGRDLPEGNGQIAHARAVVTERFGEANALFVVDQLVKGAVKVITGLLGGVARMLPIPGLQGLVGFLNTVIRISLTYVDEVILGYNIRLRSTEPFDTARQGVVLYAQNGMMLVKNAVWLAVFMWGLAFLVFLVMLAPAGAILYLMPGQIAGWSFVLAIIFAWAIKAALIEPFAIAALMQVYFRVIEGQTPDPEWDARLAGASRHFRELKEKAVTSFGGGPAAASGSA